MVDIGTVDAAWLGAMGTLTSIAGLVIVALGLMVALGMAEHKNDWVRSASLLVGIVCIFAGIILAFHGVEQIRWAEIAHAWQSTHSPH